MSAIQKTQKDDALEALIVGGDLSKLSAAQRVDYYRAFCEHLELNPVTRPFDYLSLGGKIVLYANKGCAEQLRAKRGISCRATKRETVGDVYLVEVEASHGDRVDFASGAVSVAGLKGEAHANAVMKAETKAKRRATLSICGLGMMDDSEVDSVPGSRRIPHDSLELVPRALPALAPSPALAQAPPLNSAADDDGLDGFMPPPTGDRPVTDNVAFLSRMTEEAKRVGAEAYITFLQKNGYDTAAHIIDREEQKKVYFGLLDLGDETRPGSAADKVEWALPDAPPSKASRLTEKIKNGKK